MIGGPRFSGTIHTSLNSSDTQGSETHIYTTHRPYSVQRSLHHCD